MFFKKLRSPSSSKSDKHDIPETKRIATSASAYNRNAPKLPDVTVSSTTLSTMDVDHDGYAGEEAREYKEFLAKAKKDAEREAMKKQREAKQARQVNLSPWASRMA